MSKSDMTFEALVDEERARQDQKWGEQNHSPNYWLGILVEEVGELSAASLRYEFAWGTRYGGYKQKDTNLEMELIQCAAVCKAMWECGRRNGWI